MPDDDGVWFRCNDCGVYFQGLEVAKKEHLAWGHLVKKRTPIEMRIVHTVNEDVSPYVKIRVEEDDYFCFVQLAVFKTDEEGETYYLSKTILNSPINNIIKQLNHLFPDLKVTKKQLNKLLKEAVLKGVFEEIDSDTIKIFLTLDNWLRLTKQKSDSKLVVTSRSKLRKLVKSDSTVLEEAHKHAKRWKR